MSTVKAWLQDLTTMKTLRQTKTATRQMFSVSETSWQDRKIWLQFNDDKKEHASLLTSFSSFLLSRRLKKIFLFFCWGMIARFKWWQDTETDKKQRQDMWGQAFSPLSPLSASAGPSCAAVLAHPAPPVSACWTSFAHRRTAAEVCCWRTEMTGHAVTAPASFPDVYKLKQDMIALVLPLDFFAYLPLWHFKASLLLVMCPSILIHFFKLN